MLELHRRQLSAPFALLCLLHQALAVRLTALRIFTAHIPAQTSQISFRNLPTPLKARGAIPCPVSGLYIFGRRANDLTESLEISLLRTFPLFGSYYLKTP